MDFSKLIQKRRACHHFLPGKQIPKKDILAIIEETNLTPSGYNAQPWEFIIIQEPENIQNIHSIAFDQDHIKNASAIAIILGDREIGRNVDALLKDWVKYGYCTEEEVPIYRNSIAKNRKPERKEKMALRNVMLAAMTFIYSAENKGYATCPIMGFSQKDLEEHLNIPEDRVIGLMVALGYADEGKENPRLPRKKAKDVVHWESFSKKDSKV